MNKVINLIITSHLFWSLKASSFLGCTFYIKVPILINHSTFNEYLPSTSCGADTALNVWLYYIAIKYNCIW